MMDILKSFLMIFPEWLAAILVAVGAVSCCAGAGPSGLRPVRGKRRFISGSSTRRKSSAAAWVRKRKPTLLQCCGLHPGLAGLGNQ